MDSTQSTKVLYSPEVTPLVKALNGVRPEGSFVSEAIPSLLEMLESSPEHYPYHKTFDEARDDPVVVLHSSGSTGKTCVFVRSPCDYTKLRGPRRSKTHHLHQRKLGSS
jgi:acyl-coenzyme A synthetase/AMP-(fatty) acid ligase